MLQEKEKRIFWIVVLAIAAVSLVSAWLSSLVVSMDDLIIYGDSLGDWSDCDYSFSAGLLLLAFFCMVAAAVAHLSTVGRNCAKAKIIWAAVIAGYFLLTTLSLTIAHYVEVDNDISYASMIAYVTTTLSMTVSYELAFLAQWMLGRAKTQQT